MALDTCYFLECLKQIICKARNPFTIFSQQDIAKIPSYILEELCRVWKFVSDKLTLAQHASRIFQWKIHFLFFSCLLQSQFILKIEFIEWQNEFFFNFSSSNIQVLADQEISKVDYCLIIQGKCFLVFAPGSDMDISDICYTPTLTVPVTLDEDIVGQKEVQSNCHN